MDSGPQPLLMAPDIHDFAHDFCGLGSPLLRLETVQAHSVHSDIGDGGNERGGRSVIRSCPALRCAQRNQALRTRPVVCDAGVRDAQSATRWCAPVSGPFAIWVAELLAIAPACSTQDMMRAQAHDAGAVNVGNSVVNILPLRARMVGVQTRLQCNLPPMPRLSTCEGLLLLESGLVCLPSPSESFKHSSRVQVKPAASKARPKGLRGPPPPGFR